MTKESKHNSQMLIDMAEKILSELSFILTGSQRNEIAMALIVAYKHGKVAGTQEAIQLIRGAT